MEYLKSEGSIEQDPELKQLSTQQFDELIQITIGNLGLTEDQNGTLKLKLLFVRNQNICLKEIGAKNLDLTQIQVEEFLKVFNAIDQFEYGKQRNIAVNCQGILYITIQNGKMDKTINVNFRFY